MHSPAPRSSPQEEEAGASEDSAGPTQPGMAPGDPRESSAHPSQLLGFPPLRDTGAIKDERAFVLKKRTQPLLKEP